MDTAYGSIPIQGSIERRTLVQTLSELSNIVDQIDSRIRGIPRNETKLSPTEPTNNLIDGNRTLIEMNIKKLKEILEIVEGL